MLSSTLSPLTCVTEDVAKRLFSKRLYNLRVMWSGTIYAIRSGNVEIESKYLSRHITYPGHLYIHRSKAVCIRETFKRYGKKVYSWLVLMTNLQFLFLVPYWHRFSGGLVFESSKFFDFARTFFRKSIAFRHCSES